MKHHEHHHGHEAPAHPPEHHAQDRPHSHFADSAWPGLLMASSASRVLGALVLMALLWLAVAWAVLFVD
jgi:hypothetical protein